jgi:alpha-L-arabinofuranosidase
VNLINFDASKSFGRISYYTIKMFSDHRADQNFVTETKVIPSANKQALFKGSVGFATWDTQAEYKDLQIVQDGKVVYASDFINRANEWKPVRGTWAVKDSAFAQTAMGAQRFAWLKDKSFDTYTLKVKARKISKATNAFIIPFAVKDDNTMLRAHIGSYVNANAVFEAVTGGMNVADLANQRRLPAPIETGKWYDIRLEVGYDKVDCYMDDKLLITYTEPQKFFSIAGRDNKNGDIIVKVVNASAEPYRTSLQINGTAVGDAGEIISISADSPEAENSLDEPQKYIPQSKTLTGAGNNLAIEFKPYSITMVRLKDTGWKKK